VASVARLSQVDASVEEVEAVAEARSWTIEEAKKFTSLLETMSRSEDPADIQHAALFATYLDVASRKSELGGLKWPELNLDDLDKAEVIIKHQLAPAGQTPVFRPTKTRKVLRLPISRQTAIFLRRHRAAQNRLKLANGEAYRNHDLVFARTWTQVPRYRDSLGAPLPLSHLGTVLNSSARRRR
jgi:integrase